MSSVCRPDTVLSAPRHCPAAGHVQDRHPVPGQVEDAGPPHHHPPHQSLHVRYVSTAWCFHATFLCQLRLAWIVTLITQCCRITTYSHVLFICLTVPSHYRYWQKYSDCYNYKECLHVQVYLNKCKQTTSDWPAYEIFKKYVCVRKMFKRQPLNKNCHQIRFSID